VPRALADRHPGSRRLLLPGVGDGLGASTCATGAVSLRALCRSSRGCTTALSTETVSSSNITESVPWAS
jgi:hypothetical protein